MFCEDRKMELAPDQAANAVERHEVPEIAKKVTITAGKNAGKNPSAASLYRALAEDGKLR
jgi:hypothetical protein